MITTTASANGNILILGLGLLALGCSWWATREEETRVEKTVSTDLIENVTFDIPSDEETEPVYREIEYVKPALSFYHKARLYESVKKHYSGYTQAPSAIEMITSSEHYDMCVKIRLFLDSQSSRIKRQDRNDIFYEVFKISKQYKNDMAITRECVDQVLSPHFNADEILRFWESL